MTKICECDKSDVHSSLHPAGATYCTDGVEESIPPHAKFHPISPVVGAWESKTENFTRFLELQCFDTVGWAAGRASGL